MEKVITHFIGGIKRQMLKDSKSTDSIPDMTVVKHLGLVTTTTEGDFTKVVGDDFQAFVRKLSDGLLITILQGDKIDTYTGKQAQDSLKALLDSKLPEKFKGKPVKDVMYALTKAENLPTLELQDALLKVLRYNAPLGSLISGNITYGVTDENELVILYKGKEIARPEITAEGKLSLKYTDKDVKLPKFNADTAVNYIKDSKNLVKAAFDAVKKSGYAEFNAKGRNIHFYKSVANGKVTALVNGIHIIDCGPDPELAVYEQAVTNPNEFPMEGAIASVEPVANTDPNFVEQVKAVATELKTLETQMRIALFSDPTHSTLDPYTSFYSRFINFALFAKSIAGNFDIEAPVNTVPEVFLPQLKEKLNNLAKSADFYPNFRSVVEDLLHLPAFSFVI